MAVKNPLCLYSGRLSEIISTDQIPISALPLSGIWNLNATLSLKNSGGASPFLEVGAAGAALGAIIHTLGTVKTSAYSLTVPLGLEAPATTINNGINSLNIDPDMSLSIYAGENLVAYLSSAGTEILAIQSAANIGLQVRAADSQTANLQEWQNNSGTPLSIIDKDGWMITPSGAPDADYEVANKKYVDDLLGQISSDDVIVPNYNADPGYDVTLTKELDYLWSSGKIFGFALTDNGNGTISLAYGVAMLRTSDTMSPYFSPLYATKIAAASNISLTDNATNFVYAWYNSGSPTIGVSTDITTIHATDKVLLYVITRVGTHLDWIDVGRYQSDFMAKYAKKIVAMNGGVEYGYGSITTESDTRKLAVSAGAFYFVNEQIPTPSFDSNSTDTFTLVYRSGANTWTRTSAQTQLGNTQYNRLSDNTLQTLDNNNYGIYWVYWVLDQPTKLIVLYGQDNYADIASAEAAPIPSSIPPEIGLYSTGALIARIIFKKSATNFYSIAIPFTTHLSSSVATIHNGLAGLQGGAVGEYYHLSASKYTNLGALTNPTTFDANADTIWGTSATTKKALVLQALAGQTADIQEWQSSSGTPLSFIDKDGWMNTPSGNPDSDYKVVNKLYADGKQNLNGFVNRTDSTIGMSGSDFRIAPVSANYAFYSGGIRFTKTGALTIAISNDNTLHYVYFNSAGVLTVSTSVWDIMSDNVPIATVFKDAAAGYAVVDERHFAARDRAWHKVQHLTVGTMYGGTGLAGTFTSSTLSITQGTIWDEDIPHDTGGTKTTCTHWYRNTGATQMRFIPAQSLPYAQTLGGQMAYDNAGTLTSVPNNDYIMNFFYATGDTTNPIYMVAGQASYGNLANVRNAPNPTILLSTAEWKMIYKVIFRNQGGTPTYIEASDVRTVSTGLPTSVTPGTDHASLLNRDAANSHPATAISYDNSVTGLLATQIQAAVDEVLGKLTRYNIIYLDASAFVPTYTNGAIGASEESSTNKRNYDYMAFPGTDNDTSAEIKLRMPEDWDRGTIKVKVDWGIEAGASASDTIEWEISAGAIRDDSAMDFALGTIVRVTDDVIVAGDLHQTAASGAITVGGSPAIGDLIVFRISRNYDYETVPENAKLYGMTIQYKQNATPASAW